MLAMIRRRDLEGRMRPSVGPTFTPESQDQRQEEGRYLLMASLITGFLKISFTESYNSNMRVPLKGRRKPQDPKTKHHERKL